MLRNLCLSFFLFLSVLASAQIQQGYVKTLGRPNQKGVALGGVSVRVRGEHNAVVSKVDGKFSMPMAGKKNGDVYSLQQVQKVGYELNERGVIGRQYAFSTKVPLTIVMVSTAQLQADKQRIENNAYRVAERNYHAKLAQLEKDKEAGVLTAEAYRQELQQLLDKFEKYQSLIDELAEHYAHVDYDNLDAREREINQCIENGDLERADSLLHTIFDPVDVLKRNQQALSRIDQTVVQATDIIRRANADMAKVLKQQEKDAEYLYQLYTIALAKFDNAKARQYIETRAELDTTNVEWQIQAYEFLCEYIADFPASRRYAQRGLTQSIARNGEHSQSAAKCMNRLGTVSYFLGSYDEALALYDKAYRIQTDLSSAPTSELVGSNMCRGNIYFVKCEMSWWSHQFDKEKEYRQLMLQEYQQAWETCQQLPDASIRLRGECLYCVAFAWLTVGRRYITSPEAVKPLELSEKYFKLALEEWSKDKAHNAGNIGVCYMNMSSVPQQKFLYDEALQLAKRAYEHLTEAYGNIHPQVATCLHAMGTFYGDMNERVKGIECYRQAYAMRTLLFGEKNSATLNTKKALERLEALLKTNLPDSLEPESIFFDYRQSGDYRQALERFALTKELLKKADDSNLLMHIAFYECLGLVQKSEDKYKEAMEAFRTAIQLRHSSTATQTESDFLKVYHDYWNACLCAKETRSYLLSAYEAVLAGYDVDAATVEQVINTSQEYLKENPKDQVLATQYAKMLEKIKSMNE